nr:MAG TPA: hypothetical protein [Caudoviricetes sp.]
MDSSLLLYFSAIIKYLDNIIILIKVIKIVLF